MRVSHTSVMTNAAESSAEVTRTAEAARITIALVAKAAADLTRLQSATGMSKTDVVNRAISLYEFVDAQLRAGRDLIVRDPETGEAQLVKLL